MHWGRGKMVNSHTLALLLKASLLLSSLFSLCEKEPSFILSFCALHIRSPCALAVALSTPRPPWPWIPSTPRMPWKPWHHPRSVRLFIREIWRDRVGARKENHPFPLWSPMLCPSMEIVRNRKWRAKAWKEEKRWSNGGKGPA